jgi:hypothetical protein
MVNQYQNPPKLVRPVLLRRAPTMLFFDESPFSRLVWEEQEFVLKFRDIAQAIRCREFDRNPYERGTVDSLYHLRRIAYLATSPSNDPITLCYTKNHIDFTVWDGFHRLCAALYSGREEINVQVDTDEAPMVLEVLARRPGAWKRNIQLLRAALRDCKRKEAW